VQTVHAATFVVIASNLKLSVYACRTPWWRWLNAV